MITSPRNSGQARLPAIGLGLGLLGICLLSLASFSSIEEFRLWAGWVDHTHLVRFELEQTMSLAKDAQVASRGYALGGGAGMLADYQRARTLLPEKIARLTALTGDNPLQLHKAGLLQEAAEQAVATFGHTIELRRDNPSPLAAQAFVADGAGAGAIERMRVLALQMQQDEAQLLLQREQRERASARDTKLLIVYGTAASCLMFVGAFWLLSREGRQRRSADDALLAANRELLEYAGQLEQANKELESFTYSISHDLRIPLRAITGYAGMLTEDYEAILDAEGKRLLGVIGDSGKRMGALIDDLLAFSKLGRKVLAAGAIGMRELAEDALAELHAAPACVVLEDLPPAWGDRAMLRQVWINLMSNALKYSSKTAAPQIRISGQRGAGETVYAVTDNGVGFDMQYYGKLFGVFQRLHGEDQFPGTGVGLAIVKRIVLRHGGRVWAEGRIDQGATFFFALPNQG